MSDSFHRARCRAADRMHYVEVFGNPATMPTYLLDLGGKVVEFATLSDAMAAVMAITAGGYTLTDSTGQVLLRGGE